MALEPGKRYASAKALAADVEHWLADEPVSALPESWVQRAARWGRKHRAWAQAGVLFLVAMALLSTGFVFQLLLYGRVFGARIKGPTSLCRILGGASPWRMHDPRGVLWMARPRLERHRPMIRSGRRPRGWLVRPGADLHALKAAFRSTLLFTILALTGRSCW